MGRSKTLEVAFQALTGRPEETRQLFSYAGAWAPPPSRGEVAWGAWVGGEAGSQLIGAVLLERQGASGMLHGPVVVVGRGAEGGAGQDQRREAETDPVEIAAHLVADLLTHATGLGVETLFARPQGLDRVWVRFGFIPLPEAALPAAFKGRPGTGLFGWRGGTALWSSRKPPSDSS